MDVAVDLYLAVPLLFTVLALVLASVFVRMQGAEGEQPQELPAAEPARESGPRDQEAGREQLPVEEVGAVEEGKDAAEEPSPAPWRLRASPGSCPPSPL
ncbi:uncharacterized protein ACIB01_019829 [Guaruba guarouba]